MVSPEPRQLGDRAIELFAALLLGLATIATAWCAYQGARWNHEEGDFGRAAARSKLEASRLFGLGTQKVSYDATIAALYAQAFVDGRADLQRFYKENLMRPEFLSIIDQWEANAASGSPKALNLFENKEYIDAQFSESEAADVSAEVAISKGQDASSNADSYIRTTIFLASALFFAGVTSNFRARTVRLLILAMASVVFGLGVAQLAGLAVA